MPNIREISVFLGRTNLTDDPVVRVAFNMDFSAKERSNGKGFLMHIILIDVNGGIDEFRIGASGIYRRSNVDGKDHIIGEIYRDVIHPQEYSMRVDKTRAWDFGTLDEGVEEFRTLISLIPRDWEHTPALALSGPVRIDLG